MVSTSFNSVLSTRQAGHCARCRGGPNLAYVDEVKLHSPGGKGWPQAYRGLHVALLASGPRPILSKSLSWNATWKGHHMTPCIHKEQLNGNTAYTIIYHSIIILYCYCVCKYTCLSHLSTKCFNKPHGSRSFVNVRKQHDGPSFCFNSILDNLAVSQPTSWPWPNALDCYGPWSTGSGWRFCSTVLRIGRGLGAQGWIWQSFSNLFHYKFNIHNSIKSPVHLVPNTSDCSQVINKPLFGQPWQWAGVVKYLCSVRVHAH